MSRHRRLSASLGVVTVLSFLAAGCGGLTEPVTTTVQDVVASTTTSRPPTTTTTTPAGLDLSDAKWVILGPDGLRTDSGSIVWPSGGLFEKAVARDRTGGLVFISGADLWWFASGSTKPVLVTSGVPTRLVEVIGTGEDAVAKLGYGDWTYARLSDGQQTDDPGGGVVNIDQNGREIWSAANGWSVWIDGPVLAEAEEGTPTDVETPARLNVADASGATVVDVEIGTDTEPWVRIHDFDGRQLILSRGPIEPAMPDETFLVIDLSCDTCTVTFSAASSSASLVGSDADWHGPVVFSDSTLP